MKRYLVYSLLGLILISCGHQPRPGQSGKPNVLFIAVDDLRPQMAAYGQREMVTPNLDRLAREGRLFNHHYVSVPTCGASRYALLTGKQPRSADALRNDVFERITAGKARTAVPESFVDLFRRHGYHTIGIGKISHSPDGFVYGYTDPVSQIMELPNSWDAFLFDPGKWGTGWNAFFGYADGENRQSRNKQVLPFENADVEDAGYPDGLTAELAVGQLKRLKNLDKPFFLAVGFFKPHLPFNAPKKYWDMYDESSIPLTRAHQIPEGTHPSGFHESSEFNQYEKGTEKAGLDRELSPPYARKIKHAYAAAVSYVDDLIGKVLNALEENELAENTIVILWGDHGWHLGDQRIWGKHTLSEYALRSALIIKIPGMKAPGVPSQAIVESVDIYPTLTELAGIPSPPHLDGHSLLNILLDPLAKNDEKAYSYFKKGISLRTTDHRLTCYFRTEKPAVELYDYQSDPWETRNVADQNPQILEKLFPDLNLGNTGLYGHPE